VDVSDVEIVGRKNRDDVGGIGIYQIDGVGEEVDVGEDAEIVFTHRHSIEARHLEIQLLSFTASDGKTFLIEIDVGGWRGNWREYEEESARVFSTGVVDAEGETRTLTANEGVGEDDVAHFEKGCFMCWDGELMTSVGIYMAEHIVGCSHLGACLMERSIFFIDRTDAIIACCKIRRYGDLEGVGVGGVVDFLKGEYVVVLME